jgi:Spy/CpxP family protein refolding chaperone
MQIKYAAIAIFLVLPLSAQTPTPSARPMTAPVVAGTAGKRVFVYRNEMGKWWQDAEIVKQLQISDAQASQLDQIFLDHRMRLIDYGADMQKQDLKLQTLLDDDVPNEAQINTQVDQVLDARGKLEREFTTMNLDLRKVLSLPQWRQLKSIRGGAGDTFFFHKTLPIPPAPPGPGAMTVPPELPVPPVAPEPF